MKTTGQMWCVVWLGLLLGSGCATLPQEPVERALYVDLQRVIANETRTQWTVDRIELEEIATQVLRSTCRVEAPRQAALRLWLDEQIAAQGGPAKERYLKTHSLDGLDETLSLERVIMALDYGEAHKDDCPFWIEKEPGFRGVHSDTERLVLLIESSGGGIVILDDKRTRVGGEGSGRVLLGLGTDNGLTLGVGAELGGRGLLSAQKGDEALSTLVTAGIPLLLRVHDLTKVYDFEVAAVAFSPTRDAKPRFGERVVFAGGVSTVRVGSFMPLAMLQLTYDIYPASEGEPLTHIFRLGTRVSLDIDP